MVHHQYQDFCSNGTKKKKLVLVGPNIVLIGRALYLAVREAVKALLFPYGGEHSLMFFINVGTLIYVFALCFHQGTSP